MNGETKILSKENNYIESCDELGLPTCDQITD